MHPDDMVTFGTQSLRLHLAVCTCMMGCATLSWRHECRQADQVSSQSTSPIIVALNTLVVCMSLKMQQTESVCVNSICQRNLPNGKLGSHCSSSPICFCRFVQLQVCTSLLQIQRWGGISRTGCAISFQLARVEIKRSSQHIPRLSSNKECIVASRNGSEAVRAISHTSVQVIRICRLSVEV